MNFFYSVKLWTKIKSQGRRSKCTMLPW